MLMTNDSPTRGERLSSAFAHLRRAVFVAVLVLGGPAPSYAESDHGGELDRWVPSAAFEFGVFGHTGKGNIRGTDIIGPRELTGPAPVAFQRGDIGFSPRETEYGLSIGEDVSNRIIPVPLSSREDIISALLGGTFEIMSPQILDVPSHPRFFLDINISAVLGSEVLLAPDSDPGPLELVPERATNFVVGEGSVRGRGSVIRVQPQGPQVHAGFGMAFTVDIGQERIRIKPSLVYSRIRNDLFATTNRPIRTSSDVGDAVDLFDPQDFRLLQFREERTEIYHGVGPAIEVEYETANRIGPFDLTLFAKGHGSRLFGDVTTDLTQTNSEFPGEQVFYKYRQDRWVYRVTTGVRLRLVPRSRR